MGIPCDRWCVELEEDDGLEEGWMLCTVKLLFLAPPQMPGMTTLQLRTSLHAVSCWVLSIKGRFLGFTTCVFFLQKV